MIWGYGECMQDENSISLEPRNLKPEKNEAAEVIFQWCVGGVVTLTAMAVSPFLWYLTLPAGIAAGAVAAKVISKPLFSIHETRDQEEPEPAPRQYKQRVNISKDHAHAKSKDASECESDSPLPPKPRRKLSRRGLYQQKTR